MRKQIMGLLNSIGVLIVLLLLPLLGVWLKGEDLAAYAEFPPVTRHIAHAPFSWPVFILMAAGISAVVFPFDFRAFRWRSGATRNPACRPFPTWGWIGLLSGIVTWILAWTRFEWFAPLQSFTFSPLWFSYIVVVNALTFRRTGHCMLVDRPVHLLKLFLFSAAFWWYFEYLNRFVQNWYYVGVDGFSAVEYFIFATLPFSTVLPAVLGTYELFDSIPRAGAGLDHFVRAPMIRSQFLAAVVLAFFGAGYLALGVWPDYLFPLLWVSPIFVITALQLIAGHPTIFDSITEGRWRRLYLLALSALLCGMFWEMWNSLSLAQWKYSVPFVQRFHLFEMPILGYAGYLPFGIECAMIGDWLAGDRLPRDGSATQ